MADLKDLQKMAQEGKISEKLLGDKEFISEMKKILKEENNLEISDDQAKKIIEDLEQYLKKSELTDKLLGDVSGGGIAKSAVQAVLSATGAALGGACGAGGGIAVGAKKYGKDMERLIDNEKLAEYVAEGGKMGDLYDPVLKTAVGTGVGLAGGIGLGATVGYKFGGYICKKLGIK